MKDDLELTLEEKVAFAEAEMNRLSGKIQAAIDWLDKEDASKREGVSVQEDASEKKAGE